MNTYFISRHQMTEKQKKLALKEMSRLAPEDTQYNIIDMGDVDAFDQEEVIGILHDIWLQAPDALVISVHPLIFHETIEMFGMAGIFNNINRAAIGEPPQHDCTELAIRWRKGGWD